MDSREASTNVTYMLNDFTGEDIQVRHWLEEADDEAAGQRESQVISLYPAVRMSPSVFSRSYLADFCLPYPVLWTFFGSTLWSVFAVM